MADEFESGFVVGQAAWHGLATVLEEPPATGAEAMVAAGCDWTVEKKQLVLPGEDGADAIDVPAFATVRSTDAKVLGVVGPGYKVLQNADAFGWFDPLIADGSLRFETGGSLFGGGRTFVQAKVGGLEADVVAGDTVTAMLLLSNSHDGSLAVDVRWTPTRVVCNNTLTAALAQADVPRMSLKHTKNVHETLERMRATVDTAKQAFGLSMEQFKFLASRNVKGLETTYIRRVMGKGDEDKFRYEQLIADLIGGGTGQDIGGVAGTWWAAFNGMTEWLDHKRGNDESRAEQKWYGVSARIRQQALDVALEMAEQA